MGDVVCSAVDKVRKHGLNSSDSYRSVLLGFNKQWKRISRRDFDNGTIQLSFCKLSPGE
jgi:hypothetical protein